MDSAIITGIISGAVTLIVCLINNHYQREETDKKHSESITLISYRLEQLEKAVNRHNQVIDRVYALEKRQDVTDEKMTVANHRIDDLEKGASA